MHTNEEPNNPPAGRGAQKGEQVAYNRALHSTCELFTNESDEYYPVCQPMSTPSLIRSEYVPIGRQLHYPTKWGRKKAATHLLEFKIEDLHKQIESAQAELSKLKKCLESVNEWPDDSKE